MDFLSQRFQSMQWLFRQNFDLQIIYCKSKILIASLLHLHYFMNLILHNQKSIEIYLMNETKIILEKIIKIIKNVK